MMEHMKQFDWCYSAPERYFVEENDIDKCMTERLINNKVHDPLLSSDSEDETQPNNIDWDDIFNSKQLKKNKQFVPGMKQSPQYPKQSVFTSNQHYQFLKVLCAQHPKVLPALFHPPPKRTDIKNFEAAKETYLKEQKEYLEWAKTLWQTDHCIRALRPKPAVESVYEAEFKVRAQRLKGFPKKFALAAQIPLESRDNKCGVILMEELITVDMKDLPKLDIPDPIVRQVNIISQPCNVPEPCNKHPYQFILPNDDTVSMLPIMEVHCELAHYAVEHGTQFISSECALRCLMELDRPWTLPLTVCNTTAPDGDVCNVVVLDSEFSTRKESPPMRTFKAFRHLLENTLLPASERERMLEKNKKKKQTKTLPQTDSDDLIQMRDLGMASDDDDDENALIIDTDDLNIDAEMLENPILSSSAGNDQEHNPTGNMQWQDTVPSVSDNDRMTDATDIGIYCCTCKDSIWEKPPPRSYRRWQIKNNTTKQNYDVIVHCAHKVRNESEEIVLEPHPEYQLELGGSKQAADRIRSLALSLMLRHKAAVLNVRVDGVTGEVVTIDRLSSEDLLKENPEVKEMAANRLFSVVDQLQGLMPGHYILQHEPSHGTNAMLFVAQENGNKLCLEFDSTQVTETEEINQIKTAPVLIPVLLPFHKSRKILPCAFTPYENQVARAPKKPPAKQKAPPQAIKLQAESAGGANRKVSTVLQSADYTYRYAPRTYDALRTIRSEMSLSLTRIRTLS